MSATAPTTPAPTTPAPTTPAPATTFRACERCGTSKVTESDFTRVRYAPVSRAAWVATFAPTDTMTEGYSFDLCDSHRKQLEPGLAANGATLTPLS